MLHEHLINNDGTLDKDSSGIHSLFDEQCSGVYKPWAIMIDLDDECINRLRKGPRRDIYDNEFFINGL